MHFADGNTVLTEYTSVLRAAAGIMQIYLSTVAGGAQQCGFFRLCPSMTLLSWLWEWSGIIIVEAASVNKIWCWNNHPLFLQLLKIALQFKNMNHNPTEFLQYVLSYLCRAGLVLEDTIGKFFEKIIFLEFSAGTIKSLNFYLCYFLLPLCFINKHDTLFYKVISFWVIEPQKKHIKPTNLIIFGFLKLKIDLSQVQPAIFPPRQRNYILGFRLK